MHGMEYRVGQCQDPCPPLPASATLYDSSLVGYKESFGNLGYYNDNYKQGPFSAFHSYH